MSRRLILTVVTIAAGLAGLFATGLLPKIGWRAAPATVGAAPAVPATTSAAADADGPTVTVVTAAAQAFLATTRVTGSLVARTEILVAPEIEGLRVVALGAEEGDRVKQGQVLARLVQDGLDAQIAQNDAARARAEAAIAQARSQITEAEAREAEAHANFERAQPLRKSGALSEQVFDQRQATQRAAAAALMSARDALRVAEAGRAEVDARRRELDWRRSNTAVTAPANGIVSRRTARVGALATAVGEPMFRIIADGAIELEAEVPETGIGALREGQTAQITGVDGHQITGKVRLVAPEIDKATRLGRVRILIDDPQGLRIGAFARGDVETGRSSGLAIPQSAVLHTRDGDTVQIVVDGAVVTRKVETGLSSKGQIEIVKGLAAGDRVVARAGSFLRDGDRVRAVASGPQRVSGVN